MISFYSWNITNWHEYTTLIFNFVPIYYMMFSEALTQFCNAPSRCIIQILCHDTITTRCQHLTIRRICKTQIRCSLTSEKRITCCIISVSHISGRCYCMRIGKIISHITVCSYVRGAHDIAYIIVGI